MSAAAWGLHSFRSLPDVLREERTALALKIPTATVRAPQSGDKLVMGVPVHADELIDQVAPVLHHLSVGRSHERASARMRIASHAVTAAPVTARELVQTAAAREGSRQAAGGEGASLHKSHSWQGVAPPSTHAPQQHHRQHRQQQQSHAGLCSRARGSPPRATGQRAHYNANGDEGESETDDGEEEEEDMDDEQLLARLHGMLLSRGAGGADDHMDALAERMATEAAADDDEQLRQWAAGQSPAPGTGRRGTAGGQGQQVVVDVDDADMQRQPQTARSRRGALAPHPSSRGSPSLARDCPTSRSTSSSATGGGPTSYRQAQARRQRRELQDEEDEDEEDQQLAYMIALSIEEAQTARLSRARLGGGVHRC